MASSKSSAVPGSDAEDAQSGKVSAEVARDEVQPQDQHADDGAMAGLAGATDSEKKAAHFDQGSGAAQPGDADGTDAQSGDVAYADGNPGEGAPGDGLADSSGEAYGGAVRLDENGKTVGGPPVSDPDVPFDEAAKAAQAWASTDPTDQYAKDKFDNGGEQADYPGGVSAAGTEAGLPAEDERSF